MTETLDLSDLSSAAILDALADGAYITDRDRRIVFWNRAAERITGWSREDVTGRCCSDNILVHIDKDGHPLCGREHCPLYRSMVTGERSENPLLLFAQKRNGERVPVEVTVSPIRDKAGSVTGGIEVFRDMSAGIEDLKRAQLIQQNALSSHLPKDPRLCISAHYIPEDIVGGDFYRVERLDEDRYAVLIADVTGHGIPAALYTMQLRSLVEDYRNLLTSPAALFRMLDQRLHVLAAGDDAFATAFFMVIDAETGLFDFVQAGHPPPLLLRKHGEVHRLRVPGPALGLLPNPTYPEGHGQLWPGESLLLYTDGAIEVAAGTEEELGEDGLTQEATGRDFSMPEGILQLEEDLLKLSGQVRIPDDLTLVSLYRT